MIVSHNELVAAVNKAFLGMKRMCGEADVIANMVADLQMVGLDGVKQFNSACLFIKNEDDSPVDIQLSGKGIIEVDLHNSSLACHLPVILDYALEQMVNSKTLTIELKRCHNRWLSYSELVKLANKGITCFASWDNGTSPKKTLYILNRGRLTPELFLSELSPESDTSTHNMKIVLSVTDFNIEALSEGYDRHISSKELKVVQDKAWTDGIYVDDIQWEKLKKTASAILVENSQRSIQGAGEIV